jgi:hypothetical protein
VIRDWRPLASATMVGSMPHRERSTVTELVLRDFPEVPVWPQLPAFPAEQMMAQYLEGLPGICEEAGRVFLQTDTPEFDQELYDFYEEYLEVESNPGSLGDSRFKLGSETGRTFFHFLDALKEGSHSCRAVKGQVVGPFTLLTGLKDQQDRALLYDERLQDVVAKHLAMKARWQVQHLASIQSPVIIFLDEPALAGYGSSAFISVSQELIQQLLKEVVDAIHDAGALAGIHVCANTDWLLAYDSDIDIINLDAYTYFDKFALYREAFSRFIEKGGIIAWGMVPTGNPEVIQKETPQSLADRWFHEIQQLTSEALTVERILQQSLFTPSCGCGSLTESVAERVVSMTRELGTIMRSHLR